MSRRDSCWCSSDRLSVRIPSLCCAGRFGKPYFCPKLVVEHSSVSPSTRPPVYDLRASGGAGGDDMGSPIRCGSVVLHKSDAHHSAAHSAGGQSWCTATLVIFMTRRRLAMPSRSSSQTLDLSQGIGVVFFIDCDSPHWGSTPVLSGRSEVSGVQHGLLLKFLASRGECLRDSTIDTVLSLVLISVLSC